MEFDLTDNCGRRLVWFEIAALSVMVRQHNPPFPQAHCPSHRKYPTCLSRRSTEITVTGQAAAPPSHFV